MKTEARRQQIARAALDLLVQEGPEGYSIAKLAQRVGLVPSAIYRHFSGKEEILEASLDVFRDKLYGLVEAAYDESEDSLKVLEVLLKKHAKLIAKGKTAPFLLLSASISKDQENTKAKHVQTFSGYLSRVEGIIIEGQTKGFIRNDSEPETIALFFTGMIQPGALLMPSRGKSFNLMDHISRSWELFRRAVSPD